MYTFDFLARGKESKNFYKNIDLAFNDQIVTVQKELFDKIYNACSRNQKELFKKEKSKIRSFVLLLRIDKNKEITQRLNELIHDAFSKFKNDDLFSEDNIKRKDAFVEVFLHNSSDSLFKNFTEVFEIFEIDKLFEQKDFDLISECFNTETKKDEPDKISLKTLTAENKSLKKQNKEKDKEIQKLNLQKNSKDTENIKVHNKNDSSINDDKIKKQSDEIDKLKKENKQLKQDLENATVNSNESYIKPIENNPDDNAISTGEVIRYTSKDLQAAIRSSVFIGRANFESLYLNKNRNWIIGIIPRNNMLSDACHSDVQKFINDISIRNNQISFSTLLSNNIIENILGITEFEYSDENDQRTLIYNALVDKEVCFFPGLASFSNVDKNTKLFCIANIFDVKESNEENFSSTTLIPTTPYGMDNFVDIIINKKAFTIKQFSSCLHSTLKYIICDDNLFSINLKPNFNPNDQTWVSIDGQYKIIQRNLSKNLSNKNFVSYQVSNDYYYFIKNEILAIYKNNDEKIDNDDSKLTKKEIEKSESINTPKNFENLFINSVIDKAMESNLYYTAKDIVNFHIAVKTSQLVILSGSSGTGKTQLPFIYTKSMSMAEGLGNVLFVPISPSYIEPSDVLGYFKPNIKNSLDDNTFDGTFIESQTGLVKFLYNASKNRNKLYAVIFDEMNLSQIEYWFSPFMSILERKVGERKLLLYSDSVSCSNSETIPPTIEIGENVIFIGTINLDETTKDISDRLADRAIIINLEKKNFNDYFELTRNYKKDSATKIQNFDNSLFIASKKNSENYIETFSEREIKFFDELNDHIDKIDSKKQVSYRTLKLIANYLNNSVNLSEFLTRKEAIDLIVKQTIISKINGSDNSVKRLLSDDSGIILIIDKYNDISDFKVTRETISKKMNELNNYGYTR